MILWNGTGQAGPRTVSALVQEIGIFCWPGIQNTCISFPRHFVSLPARAGIILIWEHGMTTIRGSMAKGYVDDLGAATKKNMDFRRVVYTGPASQLVLMRLRPAEDIGEETHHADQFFRVEEGEGIVVIDGTRYPVRSGSGIFVPAGARHNVMNLSRTQDLKLSTIYAPPEHQDKVVRRTKQEATAREEHFDGKTTE
jgi:mannose-6-phosphate isomerase-like protein (cupin superfamily)